MFHCAHLCPSTPQATLSQPFNGPSSAAFLLWGGQHWHYIAANEASQLGPVVMVKTAACHLRSLFFSLCCLLLNWRHLMGDQWQLPWPIPTTVHTVPLPAPWLAGPLDPTRQPIIAAAILLAHLDPYRCGYHVALKCQDLTAQWPTGTESSTELSQPVGSLRDEFDITKWVLASEI